MPDIYFSVDVEADGPIPGEYSMLSFGMTVASSFDGRLFLPREPSDPQFYREIKPIFDKWDEKALRVSGLDRDRLLEEGADPEEAMKDAAEWIHRETGKGTPVVVGYPIVFDWMFIHWYFVHFLGESPFGFSRALDMKTMYQSKSRSLLGDSGREDLPNELRPDKTHTHNALDDAVEQAGIFNRLFDWSRRP